jgi:hypothetical protein
MCESAEIIFSSANTESAVYAAAVLIVHPSLLVNCCVADNRKFGH